MKPATFLGLATMATSAAAFDLQFYLGLRCTGQRLWGFSIHEGNSHMCHTVDATANSAGSMTIVQGPGDDANDCTLLDPFYLHFVSVRQDILFQKLLYLKDTDSPANEQ